MNPSKQSGSELKKYIEDNPYASNRKYFQASLPVALCSKLIIKGIWECSKGFFDAKVGEKA